MRKEFTEVILQKSHIKEFIFISGDLGFNALEELQQSLNNRFINAGVAEQNMISVAAGLAKSGLRPWVYSIAPFLYARPFEQIRNDICLHELPVILVGNGAGYGYGILGSTHHAIDDYGTLLNLNNMEIFIPTFNEDLPTIVDYLFNTKSPSYLRLGVDTKPKNFKVPKYTPWRRLFLGKKATLLFVGPILGEYLKLNYESFDFSVWIVSKINQKDNELPIEFISDLKKTQKLIIVEEHLKKGSFGSILAYELCKNNLHLEKFIHLHAKGYPSGTYGSQNFHRKDSGIDSNSILKIINDL